MRIEGDMTKPHIEQFKLHSNQYFTSMQLTDDGRFHYHRLIKWFLFPSLEIFHFPKNTLINMEANVDLISACTFTWNHYYGNIDFHNNARAT